MKVLAGGVIFILSLLQSCFHFPDAFAGQFDGVSRVCYSVAEIRLDRTTATIAPGETLQLNATVLPAEASGAILSWTSSDENIATVSENGLVTAVSEGTATITVASGNISTTCEIEVIDNAGVDDVFMDGSHNVEVYTLQGIRLNISTRDELTNLPAGLYIVNGKKIFLK